MYPLFKLSFENNSARENPFLCACWRWDDRLSSREMYQKTKVGGTVGYEDSYLEFLFCHSKVFKLHAVSLDAAGALPPQSSKGPGFC